MTLTMIHLAAHPAVHLAVHLGVGGLAVMASIYDCFYLRLPHALTLSGAALALLGYGFAHQWEMGEMGHMGEMGNIGNMWAMGEMGKVGEIVEMCGSAWGGHLTGGLLGFAGLKGVQLYCRARHDREGLGSGDATLMLSLGGMTGLNGLAAAIILAALSAALSTALLALCFSRRRRVRKIPFGPCLTFGALATVVGQTIFS